MNFRKTRIQDNVLNLELFQRTDSTKRQSPSNSGRTLVLFFGWFGAKRFGLERYFKLYWELGYDVLFIPSDVKHILWYPTAKEFAITLLDYLCNNDEITVGYKHFLAHSLFIGSYIFIVCLSHTYIDFAKYHSFLNALKGVVFDNITGGAFGHMLKGVASDLTQSTFARAVITNTLPVVFYIFKKNTADAITKNTKVIQELLHRVPSLFLYSRNDPLGEPSIVEQFFADWKRKLNFSILSKSWDNSKQAGHLKLYTQDYMETFDNFIKLYSNWISNSRMGKLKSKL